jgi:hypothetical protein
VEGQVILPGDAAQKPQTYCRRAVLGDLFIEEFFDLDA